MKKIDSFRGEWRFLSNMYPCKMVFEGDTYTCVEGAYQAAKCANLEDRVPFTTMTGLEAKKLGVR